MIEFGNASNVRIGILSDNRVARSGHCLAEWGFSAYLEVNGSDGEPIKILFDTGQSGDVALNNAKLLGVKLDGLDFIVISHRHYDHTGGLLKILQHVRGTVDLIAHPNLFKPSYAYGRGKLRSIGIPYREEDLVKAGANIIYSRSALKLGEGIIFTGEIPRSTGYERVEGFYTVEDGVLTNDDIMDDSALVINLYKKGLVVVTGCGHSGLVNILNYAHELTQVRRYSLIVGGFHLMNINPSSERFIRTLKEVEMRSIDRFAPTHCSGTVFMGMAAYRTPKRYVDVGACSSLSV